MTLALLFPPHFPFVCQHLERKYNKLETRQPRSPLHAFVRGCVASNGEFKAVGSVWLRLHISTVRPRVKFAILNCESKRRRCATNRYQAERDADLQLGPVGKNRCARLCLNSLFILSFLCDWLIRDGVRASIPSVTTPGVD